ncbi:uncharacterized protein A1O9_05429 [Exophiala aquamarina CBS 119918]|uniref:C2H2-type domain-containing protein n=1 Tax=Exophiala aquamarina CBS 119918 TaxID=1182545 RepID=A0A072PCK2_9EURO|nr:uncharacterized protein A1O9_05429 [Exophiala aquamarina CBS 119918]KEF57512.1 hypothetical protein A1O9_05429 [Exophiala aquamarina CBS 119918]
MASSVSPVSAPESRDQSGEERRESIDVSPRLEHLGTLLVHLPDYGIVICKLCKFAVQPKALTSHLLRHHIYREKRRLLLERVAGLTLLEPDDVSTPLSKDSPLPYLPVTSGYRCNLPHCGHLCISEKRMSSHMRSNHETSAMGLVGGHHQRVYLQTFFKGNKVRYFEVDPSVSRETDKASTQPLEYRFLHLSQSNMERVLPTVESINYSPEGLEAATVTQHQLEDLMYFHQYMTCTGLSLIRGTEPTEFWTHDLPLEAATQPFLMHGILGVAAFHQALLASDGLARTRHHASGLRHQSIGLATFRSIIDHPTRQSSTALTTFARLLGVQFCAETLVEADRFNAGSMDATESRVSTVVEMLLMLKGGTELLLRMQSLLPVGSALFLSGEAFQGLAQREMPPDALLNSTPYLVNEVCSRMIPGTPSHAPGEAFRASDLGDVKHLVDLCVSVLDVPDTQQVTPGWIETVIPDSFQITNDIHLLARIINESRGPASASHDKDQFESQTPPCSVLLCYPYIPPVVYRHLASLPAKLFARVSKPTHSNLAAFNNALAALVSSYARSYVADTTWARWNGIESWPMMLSDQFFKMIEVSDPSALVLVAHWLVLLSKQEASYWFVHGQSQWLLSLVLTNLDAELQQFVRSSFYSLTSDGQKSIN